MGDFLDGVGEVYVGDDGVVVAAGHAEELVLEDDEALQVPVGEVAVLVVRAEGAGFEFFPVRNVEDA